MSTQSVQVSIVVACRNEISHIRALLESILAQEMAGIGWEAIIADGISNDGTREVLAEYSVQYPQIRVIDNPKQIVSTGLNAAIRVARGAIIMRMDAHTTYAPNYCHMCMETLERTAADNVGGPARTMPHGLQARAVAAAFHSPFSTGGAKFHDVQYEGWVDTVPYGCWRKATLEGIGLFDENLVRNQDDELNLRLVRAGGKIWQSPTIVSWYSPRSTLSNLFHQYFQYGFWKVAVIQKHRLPASWRHAVPVLFMLANALLFSAAVAMLAMHVSPWGTTAAALWVALIISYTGATLCASLFTAARWGWATFPYLPVVFAAYHLSYGLGFLVGLVKFVSSPDRGFERVAKTAFTRITR